VADLDAVLFDIDGVLVVDWAPVEGADRALAWLDQRGVPWCCITNTTSHPRDEIAERLTRVGLPVAPTSIVTATSATAAYLRREHPGASAFVLNEGTFGDDMTGVSLVEAPEDADVMVLGGAGPGFTHEVLNRMFRRVMDGAPLVAMHRSRYWRSDDGLEMDTAAYAAALEAVSGVEATVCGKPAPAFFRAALEVVGSPPPERALMVGDDARTDVGGALAAGLRAVLVRTGKFRPGDEGGLPAGVTIDSVADLPAWAGP
jgi:HAD superfamily hydrolase (TIGR01458 family)